MFFVTSQISTRLRRSRQQVSNPVSSIIHDENYDSEVQMYALAHSGRDWPIKITWD